MTALISFPKHVVTVTVGGKEISNWISYEIQTSMLRPADSFKLRIAFDSVVWDNVVPDSEVRIQIDDVVVIDGFIDDRDRPEDEEVIEITGRDRVGRLIDESAANMSFAGLDMFTLITRVVQPWFAKVVTSNARNRLVIRGKGLKAKASGEPVILRTKKNIGTRIEPGHSRWSVVQDLLAQAGYAAWSSGDGTELIVGQPNYNQEIQFKFFKPKSGSDRSTENTVLGLGIHDSVAERYSRIIIVGSGEGTDVNYAGSLAARFGDAKDNPDDVDGVGLDFKRPKRLIQPRAVQSIAESQELAEREMARRATAGHHVTARAAGHGQVLAGAYTTIFAFDTLAYVEDESTGLEGVYLTTACTYRGRRQGGQETSMEMVRKGSELSVVAP